LLRRNKKRRTSRGISFKRRKTKRAGKWVDILRGAKKKSVKTTTGGGRRRTGELGSSFGEEFN